MADFYRDLIKILKDNGCHYVSPAKGDHEKWYSPITDRNVTVDRGTKSRHTANMVLKQSGLKKAF
jgi:hypothetical protein